MITASPRELSAEEIANSLTHGFGLVLSVAGFVFLLVLALLNGDGWHIASSVIYGSSLIVLYAASTAYHSAVAPERKLRLQLVDHCCIYLLIAGSYTPFLLVVLRDGFGFGLLAIVWIFAIFGIAMKLAFPGRMKVAGVVSYLAMGWLGVLAVQPLYAALGPTPLAYVIGGGLSYSVGVIFFAWKTVPHHHAIWHAFVLAGSILHFIAISTLMMRPL